MSEQRIFALFSTPLYVNNVGDFPRPDLRSLEYASAAETGGALISGVLYLTVDDTSGDLVFHRDIYSLIPFPPADRSESDAERVCLAFNVFARGTFGAEHRLSIK